MLLLPDCGTIFFVGSNFCGFFQDLPKNVCAKKKKFSQKFIPVAKLYVQTLITNRILFLPSATRMHDVIVHDRATLVAMLLCFTSPHVVSIVNCMQFNFKKREIKSNFGKESQKSYIQPENHPFTITNLVPSKCQKIVDLHK